MNTDFRVSVTCMRHPKIRKLTRRLGYEAFYSLMCLWAFAAAHKPDGNLADMTTEDVELAAEWTGEPEIFVRTLVELRLLDVDDAGGIACIHDWRDHNGYAFYAGARTARAQKAACARWGKNAEHSPDDAPSNAQNKTGQCSKHKQALPDDAPSNAPSPAPAPTPTPAPYSGTDGAERLPAGNPSTPAEPPDVPPEPFGIGIPLVDGTEYAVTRTDVEQWQESFPGVNVPQELRKIRAWADANPTRRKTRSGIRRHICAWLSREQDKGGSSSRASPSPLPGPADPRFMTPRQRYMHELGEALYPSTPEENPHEPVNITPDVRQLGAAER